MSENKTMARTWHYRLLWLVAIISLVFNLLLVGGAFIVRARLLDGVSQATAALDAFKMDDLSFPVNIDENMPLSLQVPFSDTFVVPVSETISISSTIVFTDVVHVPINHVIAIDNSIVVEAEIPIIGQRVPIPIPIVTNIPIVMDVEVPISTSIPVVMEIPVDFVIDVPVSSLVEIEDEIPVVLDIPIDVPAETLGVDPIIANIRELLVNITKLLGG